MNIRPMMEYIKRHSEGIPLVGAEIGVKAGKHATTILKHLSIKRLYLVDPWEKPNVAYHYEKVVEKFSVFPVKVLKLTSEEGAKVVNEPLDFVYIDGNHNYEMVLLDIGLWYPKVKEGGIIGGHDWVSHPGVSKATQEFCRDKELHLHIGATNQRGLEDWWVVKGDDLVQGCDRCI